MNEVNIQKIKKYFKENIEENKKDRLKFAVQIILIIVGLINIVFAGFLKEKLSIITGITTISIAVIKLIRNINKKEYKTLETLKIPENIVAIILGIMMLLKQNNAISFIAIVWGIDGLRKGIEGFNVAIYNKIHNKKFVAELIHASIETMLSILLVFDPFEKVEEHIILLGIEMVTSALKIALHSDEKYEDIEDL